MTEPISRHPFHCRGVMRRTELGALIIIASAATAFACGTERWAVKTATDPDAAQVTTDPEPATIGELTALPAPADPNSRPASRFSPTELTTYIVSGILAVIKREEDEDYHLVLADPSNSGITMIVEAPNPHCAEGSPFLPDITATRAAIDQEFGPIEGRREPNVPVTTAGIALFDILHGQEGVAPNGIELHPLRSIKFA
jgi:hypothetical protein